MFRNISQSVQVTVLYEDGHRNVTESHTVDGVWDIERHPNVLKTKVIAWRPFDIPYEGN